MSARSSVSMERVEQREGPITRWCLPTLICLCPLIYLWPLVGYVDLHEEGRLLATFLLVSPYFTALLAWRLLRSPGVCGLILACTAANAWAWGRYVAHAARNEGCASCAWVAAALSVIIAGVVLLLAAVLMSRNPTSLYRPFEQSPFVALVVFLLVFLHISCLVAFSFALHDTDLRRRFGDRIALYGRHLPGLTEREKVSWDPPGGVPQFAFVFSDGWADLDLSPAPSGATQRCTQFANPAIAARSYLNQRTIRQLKELLGGADGWQFDVSLVGYTNDVLPRGESNRELSARRAAAVYVELQKQLPTEQLGKVNGWALVSLGATPTDLAQPELPPDCPAVDMRRSVSVLLKVATLDRGRQLHLLDYLYFTAYTITTTGYGDIFPVTPLAKGLASLANGYEVLFFIVFLSILIQIPFRSVAYPAKLPAGGLREEIRSATKGVESLQNALTTLQSEVTGSRESIARSVKYTRDTLRAQLKELKELVVRIRKGG